MNMALRKLNPEKSGLILMVVLWMLVILTLFALGMGRSVSLGLLLSRFSMDKLKSYFIAKAAVAVAVAELEKDSQDAETKNFDSLYKCGISLEGNKTPEALFKDIAVGEGYFTISYFLPQDENNPPRIIYGLEDEQRKINLNAINAQNYKVLVNLMKLLDIDIEQAETVAASVVDWRDTDSNLTNSGYGAEDAYYMSQELPYHCQNTNFQSLEELLLINGVSQEIFQKIKDYLTIFPITANALKINVNTVSQVVLHALSVAALDYVPGTNSSDADNLCQKIIDYRKGDDNIIATGDDRLIEQNKLDLNANEMTLLVYLNNIFFITKSDYFRINALGLYKDKKVKSQILAVIEKGKTIPFFWRED